MRWVGITPLTISSNPSPGRVSAATIGVWFLLGASQLVAVFAQRNLVREPSPVFQSQGGLRPGFGGALGLAAARIVVRFASGCSLVARGPRRSTELPLPLGEE